jgi:hypothetical protein
MEEDQGGIAGTKARSADLIWPSSDMACGIREDSALYTIQFEITCLEQVHSLFIFWDWKGAAGLLAKILSISSVK